LSYEIRLRRAAQKKLSNLPDKDYEIVSEVVNTLQEDPRPIVHKLADSGLWRIRAGRYRLVCAIDYDVQTVTILCLNQQKQEKK
jgi:mRNA-degrading endonuclease RelE of RelBE toxin-antitoxin system